MQNKKIISELEIAITLLFIVGFLWQKLVIDISLLTLLYFYLIGIFFETTTKSLWLYNPSIKQSVFWNKSLGINWLFGLGWVGLAMISVAITKLMGNSFWALFLATGIVGNLLEQLYFILKLYRYNLNNPWLKMGFKKAPVLGGIPMVVRLGYFSSIPLAIYLIQKIPVWL